MLLPIREGFCFLLSSSVVYILLSDVIYLKPQSGAPIASLPRAFWKASPRVRDVYSYHMLNTFTTSAHQVLDGH